MFKLPSLPKSGKFKHAKAVFNRFKSLCYLTRLDRKGFRYLIGWKSSFVVKNARVSTHIKLSRSVIFCSIGKYVKKERLKYT